MEESCDAPPIIRSSPNGDGEKRRPWRWDRVFSAEKTCKHCGTVMRPRIYTNPDGTPRVCQSESEWNAQEYCSAKCGAQTRRKPRSPRPPKPSSWRSVRIHSAKKWCECCGHEFRPGIKRDATGKMISYMREYLWRKQRFCSISCAKKAENAMWIPGVRARVSQTLKQRRYAPVERGGNGKLTTPQVRLLKRLGPQWCPELPVPTGHPRPFGLPKSVKIDLAHPEKKIAIELDGPSHQSPMKREADKRKVAFLLLNGWCVLRLSNAKALWLCSTCRSRDILLTTLAEFLHTTAILSPPRARGCTGSF